MGRKSYDLVPLVFRKAFANKPGEVRTVVRGARAFVDVAASFQFGEIEPLGGNFSIPVEKFVGFTVQNNAPVPRDTVAGGVLLANRSRTVRR